MHIFYYVILGIHFLGIRRCGACYQLILITFMNDIAVRVTCNVVFNEGAIDVLRFRFFLWDV